jgi:hypothetical protein
LCLCPIVGRPLSTPPLNKQNVAADTNIEQRISLSEKSSNT